MANVSDITMKKFNRLTAVARLNMSGKNSSWVCVCDCGNITVVSLCHLRSNHTTSCGCFKKEKLLKHGNSKKKEYSLFIGARYGARKRGLKFSIELDDIIIPEICPVLGIPIQKHGNLSDNSPSIDRIQSSEGYVKNNVWVISNRANRIKSNSTTLELRMIADAVDNKIAEIKNG